tara:strand:- start:978 stop:1157 length:180 start_codon:yes stop_codon:yes gene_type:complete
MIEHITIEEMKAVVEDYILETKGKRVNLLMNPRNPRRSFKFLSEAYSLALYYNRYYEIK